MSSDLKNEDLWIDDERWDDFPELCVDTYPDFFTGCQNTSLVNPGLCAFSASGRNRHGAGMESNMILNNASRPNEHEELYPLRSTKPNSGVTPGSNPQAELLTTTENNHTTPERNQPTPSQEHLMAVERNEIQTETRLITPRTDDKNVEVLASFERNGFYYDKIYVKTPEKCNFCRQKFADGDSLYRHSRKAHNIPKRAFANTAHGTSLSYENTVACAASPSVPHASSSNTIGKGGTGADSFASFAEENSKSYNNNVHTARDSQPPGKNQSLLHGSPFYSCEACRYSSKTKKKVARHIDLRHLKLRRYVCMCGKTFQTKQKMELHSKKYHPKVSQTEPPV